MHIALVQLYSSRPTPEYETLAGCMRRDGHTVWVATPNERGDIVWHDGEQVIATLPAVTQAAQSNRSGFMRQLRARVSRLGHFFRLRGFLKQHAPDVVQANISGKFRLLPIGMPRKMVFVLDYRQVNEHYESGALGAVRTRYLNGSRGVLARAMFDRTTFLHEAGARRILGPNWPRWGSVVPMGVDRQFLTAERPPRPAGERRPVSFIYIGRLDRTRRLEFLIDAAEELNRSSLDFCLTFLGVDLTEGFYQRYAAERGLSDRVSIRPPVPYERVAAETLAYDVALAYVPEFPADWQYHPTLKVLEYRALGMPIIATDFEPNRDIVIDGVTGLLAPNTTAAYAAAMRRFIEEPDFLARCGAEAASMRQGLLWEDAADRYVREVYQPLLAKRM
jgi:glycosyltransferase involved in cell wall biosynthesis